MKQVILVVLLSLCFGGSHQLRKNIGWPAHDSDMFLNATELITGKGYPCENYWVKTNDGYILQITRIPHGRHRNVTSSNRIRPVVVLQHGLMGAGTNYLTNLANESLAYILADAGAEVWLGNSRGNIYSSNHTHLDPHKEKYWEFSWDEMARYDLPSMIKFIVKKSQVPQVYYVGHSQGTTIGFAQFSEDPDLAALIKHFIALAPVTLTTHAKSPIFKLSPWANDIGVIYNARHHGRVKMDDALQNFLASDVCTGFSTKICTTALFLLCGFDYKSFNSTRLPVYLSHSPAGASVNTFIHWAQCTTSGRFQKFDHGSKKENMKYYGQPTPPRYDPSKMKIPVTIFRGGNDWMTDATDIAWLTSQIDVVNDYLIEHYAHLDFIWAVDASKYVYNKILDIVFPK